MRPTAPVSILLLLLAMASSGCFGGAGAAFLGPSGVPTGAPHTTGDGDFAVRVRVIQETANGSGLADAPIVIYPISKPASAPSVVQLLRTNATLGGRTDADGFLTARLDKGATYSFVTASPNWTTEARHLVKITDELRDRPLQITVFSTTKTTQATGSVGATPKFDVPLVRVSGTLSSPPMWFPTEVKFHDDPASNRQYVYRLMTASSRLRWTVNPGEYAEFGLRVGFIAEGEKAPRVYWDVNRASGTPPVGTFEETLALEAPALAHGDAIKNPRLAVGPYTTEGVLTAGGIKWEVAVDATFATDPVQLGPKPYMPSYALPSLEPAFILLGLAGAALGWSRRP